MAYAVQSRGRSRSSPQCYSCKEIGHIAKHCSKKFCNYCKKEGHIIKDCRVRPQNRSAPAFHTAVQSTFVPTSSSLPAVPGSSSNITPEQVQQMIISALSALGLQGKKYLLTSPWLIDSAASNHMTGNPAALQDVRKYDGEQYIQIADGSTLPITAVGNLGSSFTNVFVSPDLSTNLISVGQLVEENCSLHFDRSGCRVQDQASGQEIAKGPKVGRLFPLQSFSIPRSISNGVAERKNRHLLDVVRTLMLESSVPPRFWVEALSTAVYLINRLPSPTLHLDSPYSRLFGVPPDYNSLHVFGCVCFVHLPSIERHKLDAQSVSCAFLGYSNSHKGFVCYDADANKLRISRNVIFFENQYFFPSRPNIVSSSVSSRF
ncbi:hypothetical protein AAG906_040161 [Vitis piasezkii]